ncbi:wd repeat-containing protein, partial [Nannochloropsis gaditana CCMP526]
MCRLTAYIGTPIVAADLVTRPNHSIITQSFAARERLCETHYTPPCINGDGFGIGWYSSDMSEDPEPCIYRSTRPAWNDENLMQLSEKIRSHLLFAHVRAATPGSVVAERLCHPFRCGRYLFMHNGNVGGFDRVRRRLMDRLNDACFEFAVANGASDTVVCFALFLNALPDHMAVVSPDVLRQNMEGVVALIVRTCQECGVEEASLLNFVISDGLMLLATRFVHDPKSPDSSPASLYFGAGTAYERKTTTTAGPGGAVVAGTGGEYGMTHTDRRIKVVIATSEPLSDNHTDWVVVPPNNMLIVTPDLHLLLAPLGASDAMGFALENIMSMERRLLPIELQDTLGPVASRA